MAKTKWIIVGIGAALIVALIAVIIILSSKSDASKSNTADEQSANSEVKTDIDKTINALKEANECLVAASSLQSEHWTTNAELATLLFDEETIKGTSDHTNNPAYVLENAGKKIQIARETARMDLDTAKSELKLYGEADNLYNALKNYYLELDSYYTFISTMPQGYSKLTFSQAIAEKNASCQNALSEVEFNR